MKLIKTFSILMLSASFLLACSGNSTAKENTVTSGTSGSPELSTGKDTYYEYTLTSASKQMSINGTNKLFISAGGDMRMEQNLNETMAGKNHPVSIIIIGHADKPGQTILINDENKTYTINNIDSNDLNTGLQVQSNAVKIGEEKILGFNCVHARITSTKSLGKMTLPAETMDLWKSHDVPVLASVQKLMSQFESRSGNSLYSPETRDQLKQMGCDGFMVKMTMGEKDTTTLTMELTKVEHKDLPASLFVIPEGYKETKDN